MRGWSMPHKLSQIISWPEQQAKARDFFDQKGWPDNRQEAWKYTSLAHLREKQFLPANGAENSASSSAVKGLEGLVIEISGGTARLPSGQNLPKGISLCDISTDDSARAAIFTRLADDHLLPALSALHQTSAIAIDVEKTPASEGATPIILNITGGDKDTACYPLVMVRVQKGATARIAEIHTSQSGLSCPLMVYDVADGAVLHHIRLQAEADHTTHLGLNQMQMGKSSQINSFAISMGGALSGWKHTACF